VRSFATLFVTLFSLDHFAEVLQTLKRNRLRTFLTAAGVFWGVFMLVVMLGFGRGLENGAAGNFGSWALNTIMLWPEETTMAWAGRAPGRNVNLWMDDVRAVARLPGVDKVLPRNTIGLGRFGGLRVSRRDKAESFIVSGEVADYIEAEDMLLEGRFLNPTDERESRKVAVIGARVQEVLFDPGEDPIGKSIGVGNMTVTVVGVHRTTMSGRRADWANSRVFMPRPTVARMRYGNPERINQLAIMVASGHTAAEVGQAVKALLRLRHAVHPDDVRAFEDWNRAQQVAKVEGLFFGIATLTWIVGVMTLLAGAMGVSNIMMIAVAERTREIGIRKAVGATPASIITQVLTEATLLTGLAGYLGLVAAVALIEGTARLMARMPAGQGFFGPPDVDLSIALVAAAVLTVAGAVAGLAPARSAVAIRPVEALAHE
jgi:putative ABC transport system permease protein